MNDYVSDLTDYNHRDRRPEKLPYVWGGVEIHFNGIDPRPEEFTPFQKKLFEKVKKL